MRDPETAMGQRLAGFHLVPVERKGFDVAAELHRPHAREILGDIVRVLDDAHPFGEDLYLVARHQRRDKGGGDPAFAKLLLLRVQHSSISSSSRSALSSRRISIFSA